MAIDVINQKLVSIVVNEDGTITHEIAQRAEPLQLADHHIYHDEKWIAIRQERDTLLKESDWVAIRASDLGLPAPAEWQIYRQALRNITDQPNPFFIVWPEKPSAAAGPGTVTTLYPPQEAL